MFPALGAPYFCCFPRSLRHSSVIMKETGDGGFAAATERAHAHSTSQTRDMTSYRFSLPTSSVADISLLSSDRGPCTTRQHKITTRRRSWINCIASMKWSHFGRKSEVIAQPHAVSHKILLLCHYYCFFLCCCYIHLLFAKKTAANTKATKEKAEHVQITTTHGSGHVQITTIHGIR